MKITYTNVRPMLPGNSQGPLFEALKPLMQDAALKVEQASNVAVYDNDSNVIQFPYAPL